VNPQESGVATGESEETAQEQTQSLSEEILSLMKGEEPKAPETKQEVPEEVPVPSEEDIPKQTTETEEEEEEETAAAGAEGQWPQSARKRVAEETGKRKRYQSRADKAESERDQWQRRAAQLESQLQDASSPRPTREDPLADVFDLPGLKKAKGHYLNIKTTATRALDENPTLDEIDVIVGKDKNGEPITESFTRKALVTMRENAEYALSDLIPQREKILAARDQADTLALRIYPQFAENDGDNEWSGFVRDTLAQIPALAKIPDIAIWLGHAIVGRAATLERLEKQYGKNGDRVADSIPGAAREIVSAASRKFKVAPQVSTGRVPSQTLPRRGADVESARKSMKARPGDDDAMEAFIDAKLFRTPKRGYEKVS
jgi:hypothetical protein